MRMVRRPSAVLHLAACLLLAGAACKRPTVLPQGAAEFGISPAGGEPAPAFELPALDGTRVSLESLEGQVVFVNFWATWCPPCAEEMPSMVALARDLEARYPGRFRMVAVSLDEGWEPIRAFFDKDPFKGSVAPLTVLLEEGAQTTTTLYYCAARGGCPGDFKLPESYILDRKGRLVAYVVGPRDWSDPRARTYLEQLLR